MTDLMNALSEAIDGTVILAEQNAPRPPYPYIGIKVLAQHIPDRHHPSIENELEEQDLLKQTAHTKPQMTLSVTEYHDDVNAGDLVQAAHDWFLWSGYRKLKELGFVMIETLDISNRDTVLVDTYERRRGFDVRLRYVRSIERFVETIESISGTLIVNERENEFDVEE